MRILLLPFLSFSFQALPAQNLVPNGGFEEYTACPSNFSQIEFATGWTTFRVTPDYFNSCSPTDSAGVPLNFFGYQAPASGFAYAGIACYTGGAPENGREFLGIQLQEPLIPGIPYHLSFKTVFASSGSPDYYQPQFNCTGIGLRFVMTPFLQGLGWSVPNNAALHLDALITDSVNWRLVEGTYVPDSAYEYLVVGNFFDDQSILLEQIDPDGNVNIAYFYVDDVCVTEGTNGCGSTGIEEPMAASAFFWPNPFDNSLSWRGIASQSYPVRVIVQDVLGRTLIISPLLHEGEAFAIGAELTEGIHLISVQTINERIGPIPLLHRSQ